VKTSHRWPLVIATATTIPLVSCAAGHTHHAHHGGMQHRFDDAEKWAKMFDSPERDAWQRPDEVIALVQPMPGQTVADVGAGTGYFLGRLSQAVGKDGRVLGVDIEPDMVAYMTQRAQKEGWTNVEAVLGATDAPNLPAAAVDRILIVDTWHHIGARGAYAAKLREALVPGGAVFVVDFALDSERGPPQEHRLSPEAVIAELKEGGLEAELLTETLPDQYVVRGSKP
jgi:ubiquinone/menaquinone biosynthesis C-methylase UbiE